MKIFRLLFLILMFEKTRTDSTDLIFEQIVIEVFTEMLLDQPQHRIYKAYGIKEFAKDKYALKPKDW